MWQVVIVVAIIVALVVGVLDYAKSIRIPRDDDDPRTTPDEHDSDDVDRDASESYAIDPILSDYPWNDERRCWGCERGCKRSAFRPYADAGLNPAAELRALCRAQHDAHVDDPYHVDALPRTRGPGGRMAVDRLWDDWCAECGRLARRAALGLDVADAEPVAVPADAECPF